MAAVYPKAALSGSLCRKVAKILWLFVTFGDSGSRKQNCHERGEGGGLENPY
jgi:hypothetical protein